VDIDFTGSPFVAVPGTGGAAGGEVFNIYDVALDAMDFIASLEGARPAASQSLSLYWAPGSTQGTFYSSGSRSIWLLGMSSDSDAWDDSVILHEIGHYTEFVFGASDNPGGQHGLGDCLDPRLSWSEGQATFFQNIERTWKGLARPDIYVDTSGQPGMGNWLLRYQVESQGSAYCGCGNELAVNMVLWDIADGEGTQDASPGSDDDPMGIPDAASRFWDVLTNYLPLPTVSSISIEDFWDGWFARGHGFLAEMRQVFAARCMEFFEDAYEQDDNRILARTGGVLSIVTHHTIYPAGDLDWTLFNGVAGGSYTFETRNLPCRSDTRLRLLDSDGTTLLASNDDQSPGDPSSRIQYTPTRDGTLYLELSRPSGGGLVYASCDLAVSIVVPVVLSDVQVEALLDGVHLRWQARADPGFSHFEVERSGAREGPYAVVSTSPVLASPGSTTLFEYLDRSVEPTATYYYRLAAVETSGERAWFGPYEATAAAPARLVLHPARPNPFNPATEITFELPRQGPVRLHVFDVSGRLVRTLVAGATLPAGVRALAWDGTGDGGLNLASGVYLVRLEALGLVQVQRAVLVR
jgi:hypothetical protein